MSYLQEILQSVYSPQLAQAAAVSLGESEQSVKKAVDGIVPTLLHAFTKAPSVAHASLSDLLQKAVAHHDLSAELITAMASPEAASEVVRMGRTITDLLLPERFASVANITSNYAGIKSSSSSMLYHACAALTAFYLGKKMQAENLSINSILQWLEQHQTAIASAMPEALLNMGSNPDKPIPNFPNENRSQTMTNNEPKRNKWIFPFILLLLIGIGIFWWMKGCNQSSVETEKSANQAIDSAGASIDDAVNKAANKIDSAVTTVVNITDYSIGQTDSIGNWIVTKGDSTRIKLNNGVEIDAYRGSIEEKLHLFINEPAAEPGDDVWFPFEYVWFEPGKAVMKKGSDLQISNIAEMLKAYPAVKIKLGGYTDNAGDSVKNVKLSGSRVKAVYDLLISKGVDKASFAEKPYEAFGPKNPLSDNATPEGRAQNRRVSLTVIAR